LPGKGHDWQRSAFAFHPNKGSLFASEKNRLQIWNLKDGSSSPWEPGHDKLITSLSVHPDGQRVASADQAGMVRVCDATSRKLLHQFRSGGAVVCVRFSPDGSMLAAITAAPDSALYLWDLQTRGQIRRDGHTNHVRGLAWRPDSQALATASHDGTVALWSLDLKQPPRTIQLNMGQQEQFAFTPEGRHLLTANEDGSIFVLRLAEKR